MCTMSADSPATLTDDERDEMLGNGGTGVISLSTPADAPPHSVPVSYGYDPTESVFYFRLAVGPDSEKGDLDGRAVTFVNYGTDDGRYRSVVARGTLENIESDEIGTAALDGLDHVDIPLVDIFDEPTRVVDFEFLRLVPDELTTRTEGTRES